MERRAMVILCVLAMNACGGGAGGSSSPSPTSPTPNPAPTTFTLRGKVTEAPPFTTNAVAGAKVEFTDGSNAGKSAIADSGGNYVLSGAAQGGFTIRASADGYQSASVGVTLTRDLTQDFQLATNGPRTHFGPGQYRVNSEIAAGRYYSAPSDGCYFERESGFGGTLDEIIANNFIDFSTAQWIVDIRGSDVGFKTDSDCGNWFSSPRTGAQSTIQPGMWLVGAQIAPGTYRTTAASGCYWERLRDFSNDIDGVIANDFVSSAGVQRVTIRSGDAGFDSDDDCGTWTRESGLESLAAAEQPLRSEIEKHWRLNRERSHLR